MKKIIKKKEFGVFMVLVALIVFFSIASPQFVQARNFFNIAKQIATVGICSVGFSFVLITGGIDLSVGYQISLDIVVTAVLMNSLGVHWVLACILGMLLGTGIGLLNGLIIVETHVAPLIVTLSMMTILKGISYLITGGLAIFKFNESFVKLGQGMIGGVVPISLLFLVAIIVIGIFILNKTVYGRYFYAIGNNVEAAKLSGVNVKKIQLMAYGLCGFFTSIGAILLLSRLNSAQSSTGDGYEFNCLTACVVGGVSSNGGKGTVLGAVIGCLIVGVLENGLAIMNINEYVQEVIKGLVLLVAVVYDTMSIMKNEKVKKIKAINAEN
ncbi:ABC transporter permease [Blautia obeum]|uniref:ABC transporter permease n=1 Tax=Blautia obeum TaxID=40520 RepID=UPI0015708F13|nr:ABC transporter permease [Blautia obeum]NSC70560.1 ABC transporter permease [Blautia obeum]